MFLARSQHKYLRLVLGRGCGHSGPRPQPSCPRIYYYFAFGARLPYLHYSVMTHREDVHEIAKTGFGNGTNDLYDRSALSSSSSSKPVDQITHLRSSGHVHRTLLMLSSISVRRSPLLVLSTSSSINNSLPNAAPVMFNVLLELVLALGFLHVHSLPTPTGSMP